MEPTRNFNKHQVESLLMRGAHRRYNVNKLLNAYEKKDQEGKYKDCKLSYEGNHILLKTPAGKKIVSVNLASVNDDKHRPLISRIRYSKKSIEDKSRYEQRLLKLTHDLFPRKDKTLPKISPTVLKINPKTPAFIKEGIEAYDNENFKLAKKLLEKNISHNSDSANLVLGEMYDFGIGVRKSPNKAIKYYKLAADQGNKDAGLYLGFIYYNKENYELSLKYFQLSADRGNAEAQYLTALLYKAGLGVERNARKAAKYYKMAADQGSPKAKARLVEFTEDKETFKQVNKVLSALVDELKKNQK